MTAVLGSYRGPLAEENLLPELADDLLRSRSFLPHPLLTLNFSPDSNSLPRPIFEGTYTPRSAFGFFGQLTGPSYISLISFY